MSKEYDFLMEGEKILYVQPSMTDFEKDFREAKHDAFKFSLISLGIYALFFFIFLFAMQDLISAILIPLVIAPPIFLFGAEKFVFNRRWVYRKFFRDFPPSERAHYFQYTMLTTKRLIHKVMKNYQMKIPPQIAKLVSLDRDKLFLPVDAIKAIEIDGWGISFSVHFITYHPPQKWPSLFVRYFKPNLTELTPHLYEFARCRGDTPIPVTFHDHPVLIYCIILLIIAVMGTLRWR